MFPSRPVAYTILSSHFCSQSLTHPMQTEGRSDSFLYSQVHINNSCSSNKCPQEMEQDITGFCSHKWDLSSLTLGSEREGAAHCHCWSPSGTDWANIWQEWHRQGQTVALDKQTVMPSSLLLSVVCFQCSGFGRGWEFLSLKVTPNLDLGSYHPSSTPTVTKEDHLAKRT